MHAGRIGSDAPERGWAGDGTALTGRPLAHWVAAAVVAVAVVLVLDSTGVVSPETAVVIDDTAQLTAGLLATGACWWAAGRTRGAERRWRRLMAIGMGGWSVGMALWAWYQIVSDTPLPSPSLADVGFLTLPVLALPALLALATRPPGPTPGPGADGRRFGSVLLLLDGLVVVGCLFILTWATALGAAVHASAPNVAAFAVAVAYPATDLVLVVIVVLLAITRRVRAEHRAQLWLLGSGLVGLSVSDSIFAYLVSTGADEMPPITNAGFVAGPLLIAVAALATAADPPQDAVARATRAADRAHLLLPCGLVALTGAVIAVQDATGTTIDRVEITLTWAVIGVVLVRQVITLWQNTALLERVSAAQDELAHRAHHDPLTGLANRTLFGEQLQAALDRHRDEGHGFALLLVDLDDFKAVNDTFGHSAGDHVLHVVGERLRSCVRSTDTVARLGGDEFAVVLDASGVTPEDVSERILATLREPVHIEGRTLVLTASLGVVVPRAGETDLTPDVMLRRADGAMYLGKRRGKGRAVLAGQDLPAADPPVVPVSD